MAQEQGVDEVMLIGGAQLYEQALPLAERLYLTRVALRKGSLVVNSSQGGGSKDTWIVDTEGL